MSLDERLAKSGAILAYFRPSGHGVADNDCCRTESRDVSNPSQGSVPNTDHF